MKVDTTDRKLPLGFTFAIGMAILWLARCGSFTALAVNNNSELGGASTSDEKLTVTIENGTEGDSGRVIVVQGLSPASIGALSGLKPDDVKWKEALAVYVDKPGDAELDGPPVLGAHRVRRGDLSFQPRFALEGGLTYRTIVDLRTIGGSHGEHRDTKLTIPKLPVGPRTVLKSVYPTSDVLPENHLRFYLHFSAPMRQGGVNRYMKLLQADGTPVEAPFLEIAQELWDRSGTRLTVLFDPGRVKRGLRPHEEVGPILEEGKTFTFVVDSSWPDAKGRPLKASFRKSIHAVAPDSSQPSPKKWKIFRPLAQSLEPLRIRLSKPLDRAMLHRVIDVLDGQGTRINGTIQVDEKETLWSFTPDKPWLPGSYRIVVDTDLEDYCGNSIRMPFEVDMFEKIDRTIERKTVSVPFIVAQP